MRSRMLTVAAVALLMVPLVTATLPEVTMALVPTAPDGAEGWYRTEAGVRVDYSCRDAVDKKNVTLSYHLNYAGGTVTAREMIMASIVARLDGAYVATVQCIDGDNETRTRDPIAFKLDRTPPGVVAAEYMRAREHVQKIAFTLADATSGLSRAVVEHDRYGDKVWRPVCSVTLVGQVAAEECDLDLSQGTGVWCFRITSWDVAGNTEGPVPLRTPQDGSPITPDGEFQLDCHPVNWA